MGRMLRQTSRTGAVAVAVAVAALVAAGCGSRAADPPAGSAVAPPDRLRLALAGVTARIGHDEVRSSGLVLDAGRGLVLTTAHSVWGHRFLAGGGGQ